MLVSGDMASFALFGGLLLWAVAEVVVINRQDCKQPLAALWQSLARELLAVAATLGLYGAVVYAHGVLGYLVHG